MKGELKPVLIDNHFYYVDDSTGEFYPILRKAKRQQHQEASPYDIVDNSESLREWSLQRGIKATSGHRLKMGNLLDSLRKFKIVDEESLAVLEVIRKISYMNKVFVTRSFLQGIFNKTSKNLNKHLNTLVKYGILKYKVIHTTGLYLIEINPSIFFRGDDEMRNYYVESWVSSQVDTESPLVSDTTIRGLLSYLSTITIGEVNTEYELSIKRSQKSYVPDTTNRRVLQYDDIDYAISVRRQRLKRSS